MQYFPPLQLQIYLLLFVTFPTSKRPHGPSLGLLRPPPGLVERTRRAAHALQPNSRRAPHDALLLLQRGAFERKRLRDLREYELAKTKENL